MNSLMSRLHVHILSDSIIVFHRSKSVSVNQYTSTPYESCDFIITLTANIPLGISPLHIQCAPYKTMNGIIKSSFGLKWGYLGIDTIENGNVFHILS